jgi:hypothetical protein
MAEETPAPGTTPTVCEPALLHWAIAPSDCLHSATQPRQIVGTIERFESFLAPSDDVEPPPCRVLVTPSGSMHSARLPGTAPPGDAKFSVRS